jgi:hypothetical protein
MCGSVRLLALGATAALIGVLSGCGGPSGASVSPGTTATATPSAGASEGGASADCSTNWGASLKGSLREYSEGPLQGARAGRHACFDRLVLDVAGKGFGYRVEYVDRLIQEGSGNAVALRGGAKLRIIVQATTSPDFRQASPTLANLSGYQTFRQVAAAGSFEGQTAMGLGVRARLPFRVSTLPNDGGGTRLMIDVAHK